MNSKFKIEPVFVWPQINKKRHTYWRLRLRGRVVETFLTRSAARRHKRRILEQVGVE